MVNSRTTSLQLIVSNTFNDQNDCLLSKLKLTDNEQYWNLNMTVHDSKVKSLASQPLEATHHPRSDLKEKK